MRKGGGRRLRGVLALLVLVLTGSQSASSDSLAERNQALLGRVEEALELSTEEIAALRSILAGSPFIGQGNPSITLHPMTAEECRDAAERRGESFENRSFRDICGAPYMAPLYDPRLESAAEAKVCIDRFEFPNLACEYPVVWVRAAEAAEICQALGKRMCDAHEWEGACAGALEPPDYRFDLAVGAPAEVAVRRMRSIHNAERAATKSWSYGPTYRNGVCATSSQKSAACDGGGWKLCGSNTFPTGAFPECRSPLGVYDLNGNAAEHMNLPLSPEQMSSRGSTQLGHTEMKGSWFIFDRYQAHEDWCRWRAPYWHGGRVMDPKSHHNYHLGFRCCKTLDPGGD